MSLRRLDDVETERKGWSQKIFKVFLWDLYFLGNSQKLESTKVQEDKSIGLNED